MFFEKGKNIPYLWIESIKCYYEDGRRQIQSTLWIFD